MLTHEWPMVPLGDVIRQRKEFIQINDLETYKRCRVQLHAQGIVLRDTVAGAEIKTKEQQVCRAGEFLVAEIDAKVGGFGVVPDELDGAIVSSHYFLFKIGDAQLDRGFLAYFIRTATFRDQVAAQGSTNYAAIRPNDVLGYEIPLPPIDEQRRLAARIDELAAKIEEACGLRRLAGEEVEALVSAAMKQCFDFSDSEKQVRDFAIVLGGYAFPSDKYIEDGDYQIVRIGNVRDGYLDLSRMPVHWNLADDERVRRYELSEGDIVISMTGTRTKRDYGYTAIVPGGHKLLVNQRVGKIIPHKPIDIRYLYHFLRSPFFRDRLFPFATGTANQGNIGNKHIEQVPFDPPDSLEQQRHIVAYLDGLQARVDALKQLQVQTQAELDALLPSVLDRAFRGEL